MTTDHSASRRADVLAEEAPHLIADKGCQWWGWWLRYPLDNLRRVWRNHFDV